MLNTKESLAWFASFFNRICAFYGVDPAGSFDYLKGGANAAYLPATDEVVVDYNYWLHAERWQVARTVVHELTHAWSHKFYGELSLECRNNGRYEETYFDRGHFLESAARRASQGFDIRPAIRTLAKTPGFADALKKGEDSALREAEKDFDLCQKLGSLLPDWIQEEIEPEGGEYKKVMALIKRC